MSRTLRKVLDFPRIVREQGEKMDPLDLKQAVIREISWQLTKLASFEEEVECLEFLMKHREREERARTAVKVEG